MAVQWLGNTHDDNAFNRALSGWIALSGLLQDIQEGKRRGRLLELQTERAELDLELTRSQAPLQQRLLETQIRGAETDVTRAETQTELAQTELEEFRQTAPHRAAMRSVERESAEAEITERQRQSLRADRLLTLEEQRASREQEKFNLEKIAMQRALERAETIEKNAPELVEAMIALQAPGAPRAFIDQMKNVAIPEFLGTIGQTLAAHADQISRNAILEKQLAGQNQQARMQKLDTITRMLRTGDPAELGAAQAIAEGDEYLMGIVNARLLSTQAMVDEIKRRVAQGDSQGAAAILAMSRGDKVKTITEMDLSGDAVRQVSKPDLSLQEAQVEQIAEGAIDKLIESSGGRIDREMAQKMVQESQDAPPPKPTKPDGLPRPKSAAEVRSLRKNTWFVDSDGEIKLWDGSKVIRR